MNIALRKLALLEQSFIQKEEEARIQGYSTCPIDYDMKRRISTLMEKVRVL